MCFKLNCSLAKTEFKMKYQFKHHIKNCIYLKSKLGNFLNHSIENCPCMGHKSGRLTALTQFIVKSPRYHFFSLCILYYMSVKAANLYHTKLFKDLFDGCFSYLLLYGYFKKMPVCPLLTQCLNFGLVGRRLESGKLIPRHYVNVKQKSTWLSLY